ncbi:hypothetical protein MSB04_05785 [bacterium]|nr:hypothetical protein [bacterium]
MTKTKKVYPEWVQKYREKGTTIKKKGDAYYLYKRTSRRVPGKKYPQPVDTYIGIITPDGVVQTQRKRVVLSDIEVREYGYSYALWSLCPQGWKDALGEEWEDVLKTIILRWSPQSYLGRDYTGRDPKGFRCSLDAQVGMLSRRICKEHNVDLKELEILKNVYLVYIGKEEAVSRLNESQKNLLEKIGVELES